MCIDVYTIDRALLQSNIADAKLKVVHRKISILEVHLNGKRVVAQHSQVRDSYEVHVYVCGEGQPQTPKVVPQVTRGLPRIIKRLWCAMYGGALQNEPHVESPDGTLQQCIFRDHTVLNNMECWSAIRFGRWDLLVAEMPEDLTRAINTVYWNVANSIKNYVLNLDVKEPKLEGLTVFCYEAKDDSDRRRSRM